MEPETRNSRPSAPCPHPASAQTVLFPARDYITGDRFEVVQCRTCGVARTTPPPRADQAGSYYPEAYYGVPGAQRFPSVVEWLQEGLYARRVRGLERLGGGKPGRVLDVGCGRGFLLREFQKRGWAVRGTEWSEKAAACAREAGIPVGIGDLAELNFPDEHFDAVVMWHVLEHVACPETELDQVARILKPGGIFFVAVPNFGSVEARWTREKWFHLDVPRHLHHFTAAVLRRQLAAAGFEVERTSFFAAEYDAFSFTQSALNRLGLRHNLLYNLLRKSGAKLLREQRCPLWQKLVTAALAPVLGLLSVPAALIASLFRSGATMNFHVRKGPRR